ncbi:MAG: SAM-dependent chlorinase/fluorinase [Bacteroidales bacterium]|jgi:S-adenosylmethionine hydrolase|nr:SAM-dependent chlorinase/fluorinase [Bacteroidales bacterium]
MTTVTLTTDWGGDGIYSGAFKGRLVQGAPHIQLIDITHTIDALNPVKAVYAVQNGYTYFAEGTIHIVGVGGNIGSITDTKREFICFEHNKHFFIGPNNGMWEMIFGEIPEQVFAITKNDVSHDSFPEIDVFTETVFQLAQGKKPEEIGTHTSCRLGRLVSLPVRRNNELLGSFQYFDVYGNGITNISKQEFYEMAEGKQFSIIVGSERTQFITDFIARDYSEGDPSKILAVFSFTGFLEICVPSSQLTKFLHIDKNTKILVRFSDGSEDTPTQEGHLF